MNTAPIPVVICDDSRLAQKQMANALRSWNVEVTFAEHGLEALEAVRAGKGDVLFLDLTMPIMDGYQALERIRRDDLPTLVIVVSGDIQPEARERVLALGALDFIRKPTSAEVVSGVLKRFGLLEELEKPREISRHDSHDYLAEHYQEIANIAMGRAADLLARLLGVFVTLGIPRVFLIGRASLHQRLLNAVQADTHTVAQGFIGGGIAGEALIQFPADSSAALARLMGIEGDSAAEQNAELLMEVGNTLIGAFLGSFAQQLDIGLSRGTPALLARGGLPERAESWQQALAITIEYRIQEYDISCELSLIFTEDSLPVLKRFTRYF